MIPGRFRAILAILVVAQSWLPATAQQTYPLSQKPDWFLEAGHYLLRVSENIFPDHIGAGGGIVRLGSQILLVDPAGNFRKIFRNPDDTGYVAMDLPYRAPLNRSEFESFATRWKDKAREVATARFRVFDRYNRPAGERTGLWVSHHWWDVEASCYVVRVSETFLDSDDISGVNSEPLEWETIYQAQPCMGFHETGFAGHEAGGKMALLQEPSPAILLTIGDHGYNGVNTSSNFPQDPDVAWGKVVRIDLVTGQSAVYTSGHRNAQGLLVENSEKIWLTEHGARGGDELNLLEKNGKYGWPNVTYGTNYGSYTWPLTPVTAQHDGYILPFYAWVPSIAVTDIIQLEGNRFPAWRGDLVAGSLKSQALHRLHIREGRVIVEEEIPINKRIRDMVEGENGNIVLWTDNNRIIFVSPEERDDLKPSG